MMHKTRKWGVVDVETPEQLAEKLTNHTWTGCSGFRHAGLYYLNDATSGDGAQEYAVVRPTPEPDGRVSGPAGYLGPDVFDQIESITFSWCDQARALDYIRRLSAGEFTDVYDRLYLHVEPAAVHQRCQHCA